jgi:hypothetical protein
MKIPVLALLLVFPLTLPAQQQETGIDAPVRPQALDAQRLLQACAASSLTAKGREQRRYCAGFVSGVEESVRLLGPSVAAGTVTVCAPPDVTARMLAEAYVTYASRNIDALSGPAARVVLDALGKAYPCRQDRR